jgi:hypothetical protein
MNIEVSDVALSGGSAKTGIGCLITVCLVVLGWVGGVTALGYEDDQGGPDVPPAEEQVNAPAPATEKPPPGWAERETVMQKAAEEMAARESAPPEVATAKAAQVAPQPEAIATPTLPEEAKARLKSETPSQGSPEEAASVLQSEAPGK